MMRRRTLIAGAAATAAPALWPVALRAQQANIPVNRRRERQLEGIAKAKAAGVYTGRPASIVRPRCGN